LLKRALYYKQTKTRVNASEVNQGGSAHAMAQTPRKTPCTWRSCVLSTLLAVVSSPAEKVELRLAALAALERQPASEAVAMEVCLPVGDDDTPMADAASSTTTLRVLEQLKQLGPATTVEIAR